MKVNEFITELEAFKGLLTSAVATFPELGELPLLDLLVAHNIKLTPDLVVPAPTPTPTPVPVPVELTPEVPPSDTPTP